MMLLTFPTPRVLLVALCGWLPTNVWAAPKWPATLAGGAGGLMSDASPGVHIEGRALFHIGSLAADLGLREGLTQKGTIGSIFAGPRWMPDGLVYARGGFAHHHETPMAVFRDNPMGSLAGTSKGIAHRSGVEFGFGLHGAWPDAMPIPFGLAERSGWTVDLAAAWMVDEHGPPITVFLTLGNTLGIGNAASAASAR